MKTVLTITLLFFFLPGIGQTNTFYFSGTIRDSATKNVLVNATVSLQGLTVGSGARTMTDHNGYFIITGLVEGEYLLAISYAGYASINKTIRVKDNESVALSLIHANSTLSNLKLDSKKNLVTHSPGLITYNLGESAVSASDHLYNIILKVPGVVESNGALFYQGKPVNVLLDGKANNLGGEDLKDYLSGILGTNTDKLEIVLNPSARHDAQGGIVINVKSRKNKSYGLTQSLTLGVGKGTYFRSPVGFSLNYRDSMLNIYGGYDLNYTKQYFHLNALMSFKDDPAHVTLVDHNIRTQHFHTLRAGIDYDPDKKTSVGVLFRWSKNFRKRVIVDNSLYQPGTSDPDTVVAVNILTDASFSIPSLNFYLKRKLSTKGAELVVNVDYWGLSKKWMDDIAGAYSDPLGNPISSYQLNNNSPAHNSVKSITADYYLPLKTGHVETGLKISESKTDNDVLWERLMDNTWKTDSSKTNHFVYNEKVHAAYVSFLKNYGKWTLQAGLRAELTRSVGNSITLGMITTRSYDDIFPSLNLQYKASAKQLVSFTYKKSIKRFGFDIINPFINLQGQYSYHKGNPYIRASYFSSFGINWSYKTILVVGSSFSNVTDPISYAYEKGPGNTSHGSYLNFSSGKLFNTSVSYTEKLLKNKWTSVNTVSFSHTRLPDFDSHMQHTNSYAVSSVNTIALPLKLMLEISGFFNSALLDGTVWQSEYYGISAGIAKQVLKSKGSLKLGCTDIFNTQVLHFKTRGRGINISSDWKVESRFINLLFTYRFGNLNVKSNKNRKTGIEDEKARMGIN